jgi:hypothetical protein
MSMPQHVDEAEGHRKGDGDGNRHEQRGAPFPESNQRDDHHQANGFVQSIHEQVDLLLHLDRLVGGVDHD